jgi:hypothetical protein
VSTKHRRIAITQSRSYRIRHLARWHRNEFAAEVLQSKCMAVTQSAGRTSILHLNDRNTREILQPACGFASISDEVTRPVAPHRIAPMINDTGGAESLRQDS